jgi:predicted metal-binding membrane protein
MERAARLPDAWLLWLGAAMLLAWTLLAFGGVPSLPALCSTKAWGGAPLSVSLDLALIVNSPAPLALGWVLMVVAMMFPLAIAPLRHLRERSFARRRGRSMLLFVSGFAAVWMIAGVILQAMALIARWAVPAPLVCLMLSIAAAVLWQVSPPKQWFLNRCHRRPKLAAFGFAADRDAFWFGVKNGAACAGACWALMLPMLLIGWGQLPAMIVMTLFAFAESLESPAGLAWRWRGGAKAWRIIAAWWPVRSRQPSIREVYP